jgi:hypothetical protein
MVIKLCLIIGVSTDYWLMHSDLLMLIAIHLSIIGIAHYGLLRNVCALCNAVHYILLKALRAGAVHVILKLAAALHPTMPPIFAQFQAKM